MSDTLKSESASELIDAKIAELSDWRGETLARVRDLIKQAEPDVVEDVKWRKPSNPSGVPVWSLEGIICTGETYKDKVKLTLPRALRSRIQPESSTPALTPARGAPSTSSRETRSTRVRSRVWSVPQPR